MQLPRVVAHQACERRLKRSASVDARKQAFLPRHSPKTPGFDTRRPPGELTCLNDDRWGG